jgi:hypothetical protein
MREFETGATRDTNIGKPDYAGYLSPRVLKRFGAYMLKHQKQADGQMRSSDNWKKGMPQDEYMKSMTRHFMDVWLGHDRCEDIDMEDSLCALLFNVMGYLYEELRENKKPNKNYFTIVEEMKRHNEVEDYEPTPFELNTPYMVLAQDD